MTLSLEKFFCFFQVKLPTGDDVGWVSFNSIPHKGEDGTPHFPLFWSLEPRKLKKAGKDPGAQGLEQQPGASHNKRRKKQKLDTQSEAQSVKKVANEEPTMVKVTPTSLPQSQPSTNTSNVQKQTGTHIDVSSIFDHRFPVEHVIAREFNKKEDRSRVNKVGMRNVGKHLMTMGMQTYFFGYCFDVGLNSVDKELKERSLKIQELTGKLKATESSAQTIASLEQFLLDARTKFASIENEKKTAKAKYAELEVKHSTATAEQVKLKKDLDDVVAEKVKLTQDLVEAIEQKKQLSNDKAKADFDLEALQKEIAIQHATGFHKAIDQVKVLNPEVVVDGVGIFKKIMEGKLVDESEDDEE
ncbi:hypothetical protein SESBI_15873 [Sesbania bispinosa]|nr:hypothetical protein SESBI_15873 [Sesbania bispinosa]